MFAPFYFLFPVLTELNELRNRLKGTGTQHIGTDRVTR